MWSCCQHSWVYMQANICEGPAVGTDLSTTYSHEDVFKLGKVELPLTRVTEPQETMLLLPTEWLIGDAVKNWVVMNPTNTIFYTKRLIGCRFDDAVCSLWNEAWWLMMQAGPMSRTNTKRRQKALTLRSMLYGSDKSEENWRSLSSEDC